MRTATIEQTPPGWLAGSDPAVLERAAAAFGLPIDSLRLLSMLKALGTVLGQREAEAWAAVDLTSAQGWVLAELVLIGPCTQHVLAQRLMVTPSSVSQVTAKLVDQRLVARTRDDGDRRRWQLAATDKAAARVDAVVPTVRRTLETAEASLREGELRELADDLEVLYRALSE